MFCCLTASSNSSIAFFADRREAGFVVRKKFIGNGTATA